MKKLIWVVVIVIIVVSVFWLSKKKALSPYSGPNYSPSPSETVAKNGHKTNSKTAKTGQETTNSTYSQLINQYSEKLIQFDDACHGVPGQIVVKKGTKVMLDNRSKTAKTLTLDGQTINLPGYSYNIVTMTTTKNLPYDLGIDCRSQNSQGENSATVQIQAAILKLL